MIPALPTFMIFHFALSFLAPERQCLFHLARCRRASWQPQVTCVEATLTTIVKVLHRCINVARCSQVDQPCQVLFGQVAFRQPVQKPPSGSADFCDILFECVSPFWLLICWRGLKKLCFEKLHRKKGILASLSCVCICLPVCIWKCITWMSQVSFASAADCYRLLHNSHDCSLSEKSFPKS